MDDSFAITLVVLLVLAVPVGLIILLIVFIAKTNRISRENNRMQSELARLAYEIGRINEMLARSSDVSIETRISTSDVAFQSRESLGNPKTFKPPASLAIVQDRAAQIPSLSAGEPARPTTPVTPVLPPGEPALEPEPPGSAVPESSTPQPEEVLAGAAPQSGEEAARGKAAGVGQAEQGGEQYPPRYEPLPRIPIPPTQPSRNRAEWESLIGGRLLNWIGAVAITIGVGFFLVYGFQNHWISPPILCLIGAAVGVSLLLFGRRSYGKGYKIFSQGLIGAGISILYLSVYASFNLFHLMPQKFAFGLMSAVTVVAFVVAFAYDSLAVSILGWAGGFLTPFLLSTGQNNEVGLFTYIALLVAGLLAVVARKSNWSVLAPMTLGATYLLYLLWYSTYYAPGDADTTLTFLTVFWLLFMALDAIGIARSDRRLLELREITAVFNFIFYYSAIYVIVDPLFHDKLYLFTLGIGAVYFLTIVGCRAFKPIAITVTRYHISALILLAIATKLHFTGFWVVFFWSIEGGAVAAAAAYFGSAPLQVAGVLLLGLATGRLLAADIERPGVSPDKFTALFNGRTAAFLMLAAAFAASSAAIRRFAHEKTRKGLFVLYFAWPMVLGIWLWLETNSEFDHLVALAPNSAIQLDFGRYLALGAIFAAYSVALIWGGLRLRVKSWVVSALLALAVSVCVLLLRSLVFHPLASFTLIFNLRAVTIGFEIVATLIIAYLLNQEAGWSPYLRNTAAVVLLVSSCLLLALCTAETDDWFRLARFTGDAQPEEYYFREWMTLVIVWTGFSVPAIWLGLKRRLWPVTSAGAVAAAIAIAAVCTQGVSYFPIQNFYLLMNIRTLAFLSVIAGMAVVLNRVRSGKVSWTREFQGVARIVVALMILMLLTVETRDFFSRQLFLLRHPSGISAQPADWALISMGFKRLQNLDQMALSLVWLVYSILLIAFGIWKRVLSLRLVAIVLFGITILKIFIYDLSFLETLYRIFSFIGLGLILLSVSYLYQRYKAVIFEASPGDKAAAEGA